MLVETHKRTMATIDGTEVDVTVANTRSGLAFYRDGTGPFHSNRAARRQFTGIDGRHDGSKKPTRGRVKRTTPPWSGAKKPPRPRKPRKPSY